jgi:hypothetical protein
VHDCKRASERRVRVFYYLGLIPERTEEEAIEGGFHGDGAFPPSPRINLRTWGAINIFSLQYIRVPRLLLLHLSSTQ